MVGRREVGEGGGGWGLLVGGVQEGGEEGGGGEGGVELGPEEEGEIVHFGGRGGG